MWKVEREKKSKQSECTDERKQQTQCGGSLRITKKNIYVQYSDVWIGVPISQN